MSELPSIERIVVADCSVGEWGTPGYIADWQIYGRFTEDEAGAIIEYAYGLESLIQLMTDHPSARCDAILAEWRRRKDGTN